MLVRPLRILVVSNGPCFSPCIFCGSDHSTNIRTASSESTPEVGAEFCTNPLVRKISFTGSTRVGKLLMKMSSDTVKRLSLELGGNAPFVVFDDADVGQAIEAAMASKFRNSGQTCVCADRFLVHASVHDDFCTRLIQAVEKLNLGPGINHGTDMGPLITSNALQTLHKKVEAAIAKGAKCHIGGAPRSDLGANFYSPTILTNVSPDSEVWKSENFGPVVAMIKFESEQEALDLANDSTAGLASYFCTNDLSRAFRFAQRYVHYSRASDHHESSSGEIQCVGRIMVSTLTLNSHFFKIHRHESL